MPHNIELSPPPPHRITLNSPPHMVTFNSPPHMITMNSPPHMITVNSPPHLITLNSSPHLITLNSLSLRRHGLTHAREHSWSHEIAAVFQLRSTLNIIDQNGARRASWAVFLFCFVFYFAQFCFYCHYRSRFCATITCKSPSLLAGYCALKYLLTFTSASCSQKCCCYSCRVVRMYITKLQMRW